MELHVKVGAPVEVGAVLRGRRRVIPIEETAYEILKRYIESLRQFFANEEGRDEIINDIESRIAELMSDKVRKGAACVTEADVEEIIAIMGRPEDFDAVAEPTDPSHAGQQQQSSYTETRTTKRLYRDSSDKFIGGVCSGIANYLNTDPAIVRILFAIVTFGGFGLGFLIYILLWMILPTKDLDNCKSEFTNAGFQILSEHNFVTKSVQKDISGDNTLLIYSTQIPLKDAIDKLKPIIDSLPYK
jgi:phage shock protein PspC (stress-responsive transcriptional regulator)